VKTNIEMVDKFNQMVVDVFNTAAGNILKNGNILTWNVWFTALELVDTAEWENHAIKWRESLEADHGSPDGLGPAPLTFERFPFTVPMLACPEPVEWAPSNDF
jgi:hypothetical protein